MGNLKIFICYFVMLLVSINFINCQESIKKCNTRSFGEDSFVCVCNDKYCDTIHDVTPASKGTFKRIVSSRDEHRFALLEGTEEDSAVGDVFIDVNFNKEYQSILGFGGAFSDSAGIAMTSLSEEAKENLIRSYFSKEGIEYSLCRIPIAGTDFSTHPYSYDDEAVNDVNLEHFALAKEDYQYKIPLIKRAVEISEKNVRLIGSPWSPPGWMKENGKLAGKGGLLKEMWSPYANYLIRFVQEYEKNNISIWGLTTMNEPHAGFLDWIWNVCAFSAEDMRDWIKNDFGPALERANMRHLKIMFYEHSREDLPKYPQTVLRDTVANQYVDGVAIHWYEDWKYSPEVLDEIQKEFEDKFILYTEACNGFDSKDKVVLGSWERAERYASSIIESVNHFSTGWLDWNMALDTQGGPSWANNPVDSPIIVNKEANEFYKQPMFYAMGHFSKFVPAGAKRLQVSVQDDSKQVEAASFTIPGEDRVVIVILNKSDKEESVSIQAPSKKYLNLKLNPKSLETIIIKDKQTITSRTDEL